MRQSRDAHIPCVHGLFGQGIAETKVESFLDLYGRLVDLRESEREAVRSIFGGVGAAAVFDTVDLEDRAIVIQHTREPVLAHTQLRERPTGEWFEELSGLSPLRLHNLIELRDYPVLNMWVEILEPIGRPG